MPSVGEEKDTCSSGSKNTTLLDRAVAYFESDELKVPLDRFIRSHADAYIDAARREEQKGDDIEYKLEYTDIHKEYLAVFEGLLEDFVEKEGCSIDEFYSDLKDANEDKYTALFEEHKHHWFVDALSAVLDYQVFHAMMTRAARK